jgi:excisionase family DNA binding protein
MSTLTNVAGDIDLSKPAYTYTGFQLLTLLEKVVNKSTPPPPPLEEHKKKWLTKQEARTYLNISMVTLDGLIKKGKLKSYRPSPDRILFNSEELDEYVISTKAA